MIDVSTIGTGGMMPLDNRHLAALAVRHNGRMLLIDCGEGAQVALRRLGWGVKNVDYICFTHFHGDHAAGLPGMLLAIGNGGRTEPLILMGPEGLGRVVEGLRIIAPELPYAIELIELPYGAANVRCGELNVAALPLDHGMPCVGYAVTLRRPGRFDADKARRNGVPMALWSALQKGYAGSGAPTGHAAGTADTCASVNGAGLSCAHRRTDVIQSMDGHCAGAPAAPVHAFTPDMVLGPERKGLKLCYITDTRPTRAIPHFIEGADLFICEGLHGADDMRDKAAAHKHMVFSEAAALAKEGGVKALWLTHFSPAMTEPERFLPYAAAIFPNTCVCRDGMTATLSFDE